MFQRGKDEGEREGELAWLLGRCRIARLSFPQPNKQAQRKQSFNKI